MKSTFLAAIWIGFYPWWFGPAARAQTLKKQTIKPTSPIDAAAETILRRVDWFGPAPEKFSRDFLLGVATMNHVQSQVSPLEYAVLSKARENLPQTLSQCLRQNAGICGHQVAVFLAIAKKMGLKARPVEFYIRGESRRTNRSHIGVEVFYNNGWRFMDVTWGTFFRRPGAEVDNLLSITEIRQAKNARSWAVANQSDLWLVQWKAAGLDPLEYVDHTDVDILRNHDGTIRLRPARMKRKGLLVYTPHHQPNYVGRNSSEKGAGSIRLQLEGITAHPIKMSMDILAVSGTGKLMVEGGGEFATVEFAQLKKGRVSLDLAKKYIGKTLEVRVAPAASNGVGYVVFKQITLWGERSEQFEK